MILTVTLNPSVDINYKLEKLKLNDVNRVNDYSKTAGGKGLNVARVLTDFGEKTGATGFLGGTLGQFISNKLVEEGIQDRFYKINKESRNCIAIIHDTRKQTEILESGPEIETSEANHFLEHFDRLANEADIITISGSLPGGLPDDFYVKLIELCQSNGKKVILDTSGKSLKNVLISSHKPFAIKPNLDELKNMILNTNVDDADTHFIVRALQDDLFNGIECVLVSKGSEGAVVKWGDKYYEVDIPKVKAVNPVGSGDATVAGLAKALSQDMAVKEALKEAMTAGVLNAMHDETGKVELNHYTSIREKILVREIKRI